MIPGVKIQSVQDETGAKSGTVFGGDGQFAMPFLTPGHCEVNAESAGFRRYVRTGLQVSTDERMALDITLEVGRATESVMVSSETTLLENSSASVGQVITSRKIGTCRWRYVLR